MTLCGPRGRVHTSLDNQGSIDGSSVQVVHRIVDHLFERLTRSAACTGMNYQSPLFASILVPFVAHCSVVIILDAVGVKATMGQWCWLSTGTQARLPGTSYSPW
jgi:hypothetical protein